MSVTLGTQDAETPASYSTEVIQIDEEGNELASQEVDVPPTEDIEVSFPEVEGATYIASVTYSDVTYRTAAQNSDGRLTVEVIVYGTTDDPSAISLASDTLTIVGGSEDTLEVFQLMRVSNDADRTFVGSSIDGDRQVLQLPLPQGAFDFVAGQGLTGPLNDVGAGIATSDPVLPGASNLNFLYKVEVPRSGWTLQKEVIYPTERFDILLGEGLGFTGEGFTFEEDVQLGGTSYRRYRAGDARAGATIVAAISFEGTPSTLSAGLIAGIAAAIAVAVGVPLALRKRAPISVEDREQLVEDIARLDEVFEDGSLDPKTYQRRRKRLKGELAKMTGEMESR